MPRSVRAYLSCTDWWAAALADWSRAIASDRCKPGPRLRGVPGIACACQHAWFLVLALARHDELGIARCETCGGCRCDFSPVTSSSAAIATAPPGRGLLESH
jgi:hypothetical protein